MSQLVVAAIVFLVGHFGISSTPLRPVLIQRLGEKAYLGLYSVAALAAFVWLVMSWSAAPYQPLWDATTFWRHLPYGGVLMSCILLVGGLTTANPSMAGKPLTEAYDGDWQPKGILSVTRHPVMWAIGIWALVHLGANGDLAAVIFFGSIALLALGGTVSIDRRKDAQAPGPWRAIRARTSNIPCLAIISGRAKPKLSDIAGVPLFGGIGLYVLLIRLHPVIAGVSVPSPIALLDPLVTGPI